VSLIADGAMFQSLMKMDMRVPDVPILEMTHGTVEINMIPLPAHQDGLVMRPQTNALWPTQEMDSEVNQPVKTTAKDIHKVIHTDATQPATSARNAKRMILDAMLIDQLHALTA